MSNKPSNKPKIDTKLFNEAIKSTKKTPLQTTITEEERNEILISMYFKIEQGLKKSLLIYLANEGLYIQQYLNNLIKEDLISKDAY